MKKLIMGIMIISLTTSVCADEVVTSSRDDSPGYASRDATTLSMMGWGITIAIGVAALVCLIPNHTTPVVN